MKIAYLGNYEAPWCTEVDITRELEGMGHEVVRIQEPHRADTGFLGEVAFKASDCAALFFQRTWGLPAQATDVWRILEGNGVKTASYHLDLYHGLQRQASIDRDPFWTTQYVFTPDGNPAAAEWFADHGVNHVYMEPAVASDECYRGSPREEFAHDVVFVGSYGYHDEWPHRVELIDWLAKTYGDRFKRFGGDTTPGPVRNRDLNDLYASAKVVVGDSCFAHRRQRYWSDRPYESWGRGAYMIFPHIDALAASIGPYPSWDVGDWSVLKDLIDGALGDAYHRDQSSAGLHDSIRTNHTYRRRLTLALETMGLS